MLENGQFITQYILSPTVILQIMMSPHLSQNLGTKFNLVTNNKKDLQCEVVSNNNYMP